MINFNSILDISTPISAETIIWPGTPQVKLEPFYSILGGDPVNDTLLSCSLHTGTHIDAPSHWIHGGRTIDQIGLEILLGEALVVQVDTDLVDVCALKRVCPPGVKRLIIKTRNSFITTQKFQPNFVGITEEASAWLAAQDVCLVGIDYLSVQRPNDSPNVHLNLLRQDVIILEGLRLSNIVPGKYLLICLPIRVIGVEASLARAVLVPLERGNG